MKKLSKLTGAAVAAALLMAGTNSLAVDVNVNNTRISFDVEPQIINDRTMVPMRAIFEVLGARVDWDGGTQTVTATRGADTIKLTIGSPQMTVNGSAKILDSAPVMTDSRTLVPVRAISEALGSEVVWNEAAQTVNITDNSTMVNLSAATKYKPAWKTAYSSFLNGKTGNFELIYLTDDDIPELVVAKGGAHLDHVNIYTYVDGHVQAIVYDDGFDDFGTYGTISYKERGNILETGNGGNHGFFSTVILDIIDNVAYMEHIFEVDTNTNTATWNDAKVSVKVVESEVDRITAGYKSAGYFTGKKISSENVKEVLGL